MSPKKSVDSQIQIGDFRKSRDFTSAQQKTEKT